MGTQAAKYAAGSVAGLAQTDAQETGLQSNVILSQWNIEEGINSTSQWPGNNPAGITPGNAAVDALASGTNSNGFLTFSTPQAGAQAYATLINTDPNYAGVRAAAKTNNAANQLAAIVASPWDAGHYTTPGAPEGSKLYSSYNSVTGGNIKPGTSASSQSGTSGMPANLSTYTMLGAGAILLLAALL